MIHNLWNELSTLELKLFEITFIFYVEKSDILNVSKVSLPEGMCVPRCLGFLDISLSLPFEPAQNYYYMKFF